MSRFICILFYSLFLLPAFCVAQDWDELNNQADRERLNRNYSRSIELTTQALGIKINARSYLIRADNYYEQGKYEMAIADYNSALTYYYDYYASNDKEKGSLYYFRGRCKLKLNRYTEAISDFTSSISFSYSGSGYAYWDRGICNYDLGKYKEADDDYSKAAERFSNPEDLSIIYKNRGDCQAKLGNYSGAYSFYDRAMSYNPKNYRAIWQKGYYKDIISFDDQEALVCYTRAIEIINAGGTDAGLNDLAILYRNKALVHKNLKQNAEALDAINKTLAIDPNRVTAYRTRAEINAALKKYNEAKKDYENALAIETDPKKRADIYIDRYNMSIGILDYKSCLADINKAIELNPAYAGNFWYRSDLYGYRKNYALAIKDCNTALELYKNDSSSTASMLWRRAQHKDFSGDFQGAVADYQSYLRYYPRSYGAYYELGRLYKLKIKNNDLANANLAKALDLALEYKDTVKACYIKLVKGEKDQAIKEMLLHLQLTPETDNYNLKWNLHNLACMYAMAGNTVKGFEYLEKSMKAGFDDYLHLVNDRDLVTLMKLPQWKVILTKYKVPAVVQ